MSAAPSLGLTSPHHLARRRGPSSQGQLQTNRRCRFVFCCSASPVTAITPRSASALGGKLCGPSTPRPATHYATPTMCGVGRCQPVFHRTPLRTEKRLSALFFQLNTSRSTPHSHEMTSRPPRSWHSLVSDPVPTKAQDARGFDLFTEMSQLQPGPANSGSSVTDCVLRRGKEGSKVLLALVSKSTSYLKSRCT